MSSVSPYSVAITDSQIEDLKSRLALTRLPDELDDAAWDLGSPLADIKRLKDYWQKGFDWRKAEKQINTLPHFTTNIQCQGFEDLRIHFLHRKSKVKGAVPLLFAHGWPGSFLEVTKIIETLASPPAGQVAFDVVAPSLPNFGFSEGTKKRGFGLEQYAETLHKLMTERLGYNEYVTQGGDWGYGITRAMSILYPQQCKAVHTNSSEGIPPSLFSHPFLFLKSKLLSFTAREQAGVKRSDWFDKEGFGYNREHSTKPQTIGYGLADSPVALLAWIYEKLHDWTDNYPWTDNEILTWVSVYWFSTAGPAASVRIYYEMNHEGPPGHAERTGRKERFTGDRLRGYIPGKYGVSSFPWDISVMPKAFIRASGDMVFERDHDKGGHFAAWELPEVLVEDVQEMYGKGGGAYGVVDGRTGY